MSPRILVPRDSVGRPGFTTPRKMSYSPDNRVINFRSRHPVWAATWVVSRVAVLRRRRRCKYIYYGHPCRPGSAGKKRPRLEISSGTDCLPLFLELAFVLERGERCQDREANLRLLWIRRRCLWNRVIYFPFSFPLFFSIFYTSLAPKSSIRKDFSKDIC